MFNLFELMTQQAQGQSPAEMLARQFGVSPPQAESAIDALLPAFALVLQRRLQDPTAWPKLFQIFAVAQQQTMMETAMKAMAPQQPAPTMGGDLAGMMFGSQEVARQIAAQAAAMTGMQPQVLQEMMTTMATSIAEAMGKTMAEQGMGAWMRAMGAAPQPTAQASAQLNPFAAFTELMGTMMGAAGQPQAAKAPAPEMPKASDYLDPEAMGALINQMLGGKPAPAAPDPEPEPAPEPVAPPTSSDLGLEALSQLVETGREVQEQQFKAMQSILSQMFAKEAGRS